MSLTTKAGNLLIYAHHGLAAPLLPRRYISISTYLCGRGIRGTLRGLNIREEEAEDITMEDIERLTHPDFEEWQKQAPAIERDSIRHQAFIQQKTIKQKYFKKYEPVEENLLTWAMKEQLKYLHATDPDLWTPEALATAFPISPQGATKLLKAKWVPDNEAAIERHDKAVLARWQRFTNGQLGSAKLLEEILKKKLGTSSEKLPVPLMDSDQLLSTLESLKFENTEKAKTAASKNKAKGPKVPKMKSGSFVSIIEDYEAQVRQNSESKATSSTRDSKKATSDRVNLSVITSGAPQYEGNYSKISVESVYSPVRRTRKNKDKKKLMTLEEFLSSKQVS